MVPSPGAVSIAVGAASGAPSRARPPRGSEGRPEAAALATLGSFTAPSGLRRPAEGLAGLKWLELGVFQQPSSPGPHCEA